jgi:hypothetical protein
MMSILTGLKKYTKCVNSFITSKFLSRVRGHCFCNRVRTGSKRQTRTSLFFTLSNVTLLRPSAASLLDRLIWLEFYVLLTVHLGSILVNNQLDAQFFFFSYMFIPIFYMFRATLCPSSRESSVSKRYLVYVNPCRWTSSVQVWMELVVLSKPAH